MQTIAQTLSQLACGTPQRFRNVTLWPLLSDDVQPSYLTLDEALDRNVVRITEVSEHGSVPELRFRNTAEQPVLLVDGEEIVGAKQNRILNLTILVGADREVVIPVSCVEAGRWSYRSRQFSSAKRKLFASARGKKMAQVSQNLERTGSRESDQGEVWKDIGGKFSQMKLSSPSMAMSDLYAARDRDLAEYKKAFQPVPGQVGAVVGIGDRIVDLELFDAQRTFAKLLEKIVSSYTMNALDAESEPQVSMDGQAVEAFLREMRDAPCREHPAVAEGTDVRLSAPQLAGAALVESGRVVHLAGFRLVEEAV